MKNRIKLFISIISIIIIQLIFSIKSIAVELSTNPNYTNEQIAIREVADAYYQKEINGQYCGYRLSRFYSPEEATSQHNIYSVCSDFTFSVYYQAFGIKCPPYTHHIIAYAEQYYDKDNVKTNDVIEYWKMTKDENGNRVYQDNKGNIKNINLTTESGRKEYAAMLLKDCQLQVGDIICYHSGVANKNEGHALMVYDIIYNESGEPVDAIIRESTSQYEKKTTKITNGLSFADIFNENNNVHEGTFKESFLANKYNTSSSITRNSVVYNFRNMSYFTIFRPLLKDENGEYTGKYYLGTYKSQSGVAPTGYVYTGRTLTDYEITSSAANRIQHSKIGIEKTVDVFNNSVVGLGDKLEYTIKITNNSDVQYDNFDVIENISEYVEVLNNAGGSLQNETLRWTIQNLEAKQSVEIKYTVKVKEDKFNLGKEIISTGTVAGIPSSTVKNTIAQNLKQDEKTNIKTKTQTMLNAKSYYGQALISKIYEENFGIDIHINDLVLTDLIKTENGTTYYPNGNSPSPSIYLNEENRFSDMLLANYYGALYTTASGLVYLKNWENSVSNFEYFGSRSERAENIYQENLQTGDILVYQNKQTANDDVVYQTEDGTYYMIYISQEDKITVNNEELYGFIGLDENGIINRIYQSESDVHSYDDLRTLLGKDYYVILRPSMVLDIVPMELQLNYDTTEITNQDVKVTITSNEEMLQVEGWTLSEDKKGLTKTYAANTEDEFKVYDYGGNEKSVEIKIENIDKEKPILDINYNTTKATNQNVIVTINANEELKNVGGWTLSEDKKTLTKTYTENKSENIEITDLAGNTSTAVIDIKNIDKEKPVVDVKYSTTEKTLEDVIVTIEANEELQEVEGWQLSDDKKILTKTYTKNGEENITIYDLAGNSIVESIKVENIDKEKPQYEVKYSTTLSTNEDVTVTITANEEIQSVEGWTLSEDKKVLTKTYTENTEEEVIIKDLVGNSASKTIIKINNIDKIKPEINISYSITELTNQDIIVTIIANEEIKEIEGWNLSTDKKELKKKFTSNTEENITIFDLARNTISDTIKISNIDKVAPKIEAKYSTTSATNKDVIVTITSDKIIRSIDGWTLSSDKKQLTKTFTENGEEEITITDEAGNSVTTNIKVSNIDKTEVNQVDTKATSNNDTTTAKMILPNTGEKSILIFIVIFMILSTIMYIKLKKYKDVK